MHLMVVFLLMNHQCMVMNHLKLNDYSLYTNVPFLIIDFINSLILTSPISSVKNPEGFVDHTSVSPCHFVMCVTAQKFPNKFYILSYPWRVTTLSHRNHAIARISLPGG